MKFNIYYLNFSKVYEIRMLLDNVLRDSYVKESFSGIKSNKSFNLSLDGLDTTYSKAKSEYFRLTELLKVKNTKSTILRSILPYVHKFDKNEYLNPDDLVMFGGVKINFFDDIQTNLVFSMISKNALDGIKYEDFNLNNLFLTMVEGTFFLLTFFQNDEQFVFKIPIENESEFESNYSIYDLLLGKLSVIGVYKGKINKDDILRSNINFFNEISNNYDDKVKKSNSADEIKHNSSQYENQIHYIDILAVIQDINFNEVTDEQGISWFKKLTKFLKGVLK